jgi:hypothetical protein
MRDFTRGIEEASYRRDIPIGRPESKPLKLQPIALAPRDGREVLCTDGQSWRVCRPKLLREDVWEYHRDEKHAPGHSWSMVPTHFILLEDLPSA